MASDTMHEDDDEFESLLSIIESKLPEGTISAPEQNYSIKRKIEERLERKRLMEEYGVIDDF